MNRAHIVTTRTGIVIGGAWTPAPPQLGTQGEIIQTALLSPGKRRSNALVIVAIAGQVLIGGAICWALDRNLIATYRRHRAMYFSRRAALKHALVVSIPFFR